MQHCATCIIPSTQFAVAVIDLFTCTNHKKNPWSVCASISDIAFINPCLAVLRVPYIYRKYETSLWPLMSWHQVGATPSMAIMVFHVQYGIYLGILFQILWRYYHKQMTPKLLSAFQHMTKLQVNP